MKIDYSKYFINYNFINNYNYDVSDYISDMLIKNYKLSIYNVDIKLEGELISLQKLDEIMGLYIKNIDFYKFVQDWLKNNDDNIQDLNIILFNIYNLFKNDVSGFVSVSKWI